MTVHELVVLQRNSFARNHPYSVDERIIALERLQEIIQRREGDICHALQQDLGKCPEEGYMTEVH